MVETYQLISLWMTINVLIQIINYSGVGIVHPFSKPNAAAYVSAFEKYISYDEKILLLLLLDEILP